MLLKQMRYFMAVVNCHSFTEAAEECFISQSAISQQIKALEEELGVQLIKREKRQFSLTPAGEYFYRNSINILEMIDRIKSETIQIGQYDDLHLTIGFLKNFGGREIREAIAKFSNLYPEVSLDIRNGNHEDLYDLLRFNEADMVLNDQRRAFSDIYVNYLITESPSFIEVSVQNKLSKKKYVTMDDLKTVPCIIIASKEQQEHEVDYYQNTLGFGGNIYIASDLEAARLMVSGNQGILPLEGHAETGNSTTIKRVPIFQNGHQYKRNYCLFWKKERTGYYIEEFAQILYDIFHEKEG